MLEIPEEIREEARRTKPPEAALRLGKPKGLVEGLESVAVELRELQKWLIDALSSRKVLLAPLGDDALDKLHALIAIQHQPPAALALALVEAHGLEAVLTALITPRKLHLAKGPRSQPHLERGAKQRGETHSFWLSVLESHFDAAPSATRERLRAVAVAHRPELDLVTRSALCRLFQDERWADEDATALLATHPKPGHVDRELSCLLPLVEDEELFEQLVALTSPSLFTFSAVYARVLLRSEERASRRLARLLKAPLADEATAHVLSIVRVLSCLTDTTAASAIAEAALIAKDAAKAYFLAHPEHRELLEALAQGRGKRPQAYQALLVEMDRKEAAAAPLSADAALPTALAAPPWLLRDPPWPARDVALIADGEHLIESDDLERQRHHTRSKLSEEEIVAKAKKALLDASELAALSDELALAHIGRLNVYALPSAVARFGLRALPALARVLNDNPKKVHADVLVHVRSPRFAAVAWGFHHDEAWLLDEPELSALGLIPELFVLDPARRYSAELGLLRLCVAGYRDRVEAAAARYGQLEQEVLRILDRDAHQRLPDPLPALPKAFADSSLPVLETEHGPLPASTIPTVGMLLRVSRIWLRHPGLTELRETCSQASRDAFAWELYDKTQSLDGVAHLGGDACVRKLDAILSNKRQSLPPADRFHAFQVLGRVGTPLAIVLLRKHALQSPYADRADFIEGIFAEMARVRGQTQAALEDEAFGALDVARALPALSFGSRKFSVNLDEHLQPVLRDDAGHLVPKLPKPGKKDDADEASRAKLQLEALKLDLDDVRQTVLTFFERALASARSWNLAHFEHAIVGHPLLWHVVRRLVLSSGDVHFRVAEDQTFADAEDSLVQLPEDARVSIAHPIQLSEPELAGFRQLFVDYEIIQPFPQLERGVFRLSADERETPSLACFVGRKVESAALTKLLGGPGWVQGEGYRIQKPLGPRRFGVRYTHHYAHGDTPAAEELLELQLSEGGKPVPLSRLTEIEASELLRDLETLPRVP